MAALEQTLHSEHGRLCQLAAAEERAAWKSAAGDRKLSDWIRDTLNAAAAGLA